MAQRLRLERSMAYVVLLSPIESNVDGWNCTTPYKYNNTTHRQLNDQQARDVLGIRAQGRNSRIHFMRDSNAEKAT